MSENAPREPKERKILTVEIVEVTEPTFSGRWYDPQITMRLKLPGGLAAHNGAALYLQQLAHLFIEGPSRPLVDMEREP